MLCTENRTSEVSHDSPYPESDGAALHVASRGSAVAFIGCPAVAFALQLAVDALAISSGHP